MNINRCFLSIIFSLSTALLFSQSQFDGLWSGAIKTGGLSLDINIEINSQTEEAFLSVPIQNIDNYISSSVKINGDTIKINFSKFNSKFSGIIQTKKTIEGYWVQGRRIPLDLTKTDKKTELLRPQTPTEPYAYQSTQLNIPTYSPQVTLSATLTQPNGKGPWPLAILVSGSGPQNRNSEILKHKPFLVIADYLTRNGVAVLRYDERGVGKSTGVYYTATSHDLSMDVESILEYALDSLENIAISKIGIIGHSEGGMIAPMIASRNDKVDFLVSIAGPGIPIAELMTNQNLMILDKSGMSKAGLEITNQALPKIYAIVNQEKEPHEIFDTLISEVHNYYDALSEADQKLIAPNKSNYYMVLSQTFFTPWFRYFLAYDPKSSWQNVKCPVFAINGSEDIQIEAKSNLKEIKKNLCSSGNKKVKTKIFKGLNHLMQPCTTCTLAEYATIETTFDKNVLSHILKFITSL